MNVTCEHALVYEDSKCNIKKTIQTQVMVRRGNVMHEFKGSSPGQFFCLQLFANLGWSSGLSHGLVWFVLSTVGPVVIDRVKPTVEFQTGPTAAFQPGQPTSLYSEETMQCRTTIYFCTQTFPCLQTVERLNQMEGLA